MSVRLISFLSYSSHVIVGIPSTMLKYLIVIPLHVCGTGKVEPKFIELPKQTKMVINVLLSRNEQDIIHKLCMRHGIVASNLVLVSIILMCLATF